MGRSQKNLFVGRRRGFLDTQKNHHLLFFFENDGDDKNDNHILVGSKLSVACSEITRSRGLTIFENEAVKTKTRPPFYSKISTSQKRREGNCKGGRYL